MINLGVIGFGGIARGLHLPEATATGRFCIKAVADIAPNAQMLEKFNIQKCYTDYRDLLADPEIDAVAITSPHDCHLEHCVAAFEAGKHVLIEKPIARNLKEAEAIIAAAQKAGTVGMIGFCERFLPKYHHIKGVLAEGKLGKLLSARIDHYQNFNPAAGSWWREAERVGGGAVIGSGVHRLDLLRWYFGEAVSVYAQAVKMPARLEAEACAHAVITFDSGVIANFSINWASYNYLYYEGFSVSGEDGLLVVGASNKIGLAGINNGKLQDFEPVPGVTMYDHFADCIEKGIPVGPSLTEGYRSLQLVRAIYRSIETGGVVDPREVTE